MKDFVYQNPTKILFGKSSIGLIDQEIPQSARVLITYGGGSVIKNGTLSRVREALAKRTIVEFEGIEPNPEYETLMKAVEIVRRENIDFILAVGGGSVIDGTKFIAAASRFAGEPWDILAAHAPVQDAVPFGTVLTLPATGSEMNCGAVITRSAQSAKLVFMTPHVFPRFSALDPETTYSLPARQTANGIVDAFIHVLEQYLTYPAGTSVQDRFSEGLLMTLIEQAPRVLADPEDYNARANIMFSATLALNGLIATGVSEDWTTHMIGHEITALHGIDHARTLAAVLFGVMAVRRSQKQGKLLQYAERVWGITSGSDDDRIDDAIARTRAFFEELGVPTRLSAYGLDANAIPPITAALEAHGLTGLGEHGDIAPAEAGRILQACL